MHTFSRRPARWRERRRERWRERRHARRRAGAALGALLALAMTDCGAQPEPPRDAVGQVAALRFAGVDLIYALQRLAGEAGLLLVLDEVRPRGLIGEDLALERVDLDLPAGPIEDALARLQEVAKFDFEIEDGVLLVHSSRSLEERSALDAHRLPGVQLEVDFPGLLRWIGQTTPDAYLHMGARRGQPVYRRVALQVEPGTSVFDLLVDFSRAVGAGLRIRRAGYKLEGHDDRVVATTVGMLSALDEPQPAPPTRSSRGITWALANLEDRSGVPICVIDRSALLDLRGSLNYIQKIDRGLPLDAALDAIAWRGSDVDADFTWERLDGVVRVRSRHFDYYLTGRDLLDERLEAGVFEGSLAELARWINGHRREPSSKVLAGGEILDSAPRARIEIADGTRVEDALIQFAAAAGEGWSLVVRDSVSPVQPMENTWAGAYLSRLADWGHRGPRPRN